MVKMWDEDAPVKYLNDTPEVIKARFLPFTCGVNVNDMMAETYLRQLLDEFPGIVKGLGEIMSRHDDLTTLTSDKPSRANSTSIEKRLLILIHHNISPSYMDKSLCLSKIERAWESNRKANIIWVQVGISRRVELSNLSEIADTVLKHHQDLHFDISWIAFENYIAKDDRPSDLWVKLIEQQENRFMIGTDVVDRWTNYITNLMSPNTMRY